MSKVAQDAEIMKDIQNELDHAILVNEELQKTLEAKHTTARVKRREAITGPVAPPRIIALKEQLSLLEKEKEAIAEKMIRIAPLKELEKEATEDVNETVLKCMKENVPRAAKLADIDKETSETQKSVSDTVSLCSASEEGVETKQREILSQRDAFINCRDDVFDKIDDIDAKECSCEYADAMRQFEDALASLEDALQKHYLASHSTTIDLNDTSAQRHARSVRKWIEKLSSLPEPVSDLDLSSISLVERSLVEETEARGKLLSALARQESAKDIIIRSCLHHYLEELYAREALQLAKSKHDERRSFLEQCRDEEEAAEANAVAEADERGRVRMAELRGELDDLVLAQVKDEREKLDQIRKTVANSYAREVSPAIMEVREKILKCEQASLTAKEKLKVIELRLAEALSDYEKEKEQVRDRIADAAENARERKIMYEEGMKRLRIYRLEFRSGSANLGIKADEIASFLRSCLAFWEEDAAETGSEARVDELRMVLKEEGM